MAETTARKRGPGKPFKPGQSGNPKGRPKGSRHKLSEAFVAALASDFEQHGERAIRHVRETDPSTYVRVVASIVPKDATLTIDDKRDPTDWTRDELVALLGDARNGSGRASQADGRGRESDRVH